RTGTDEQRREDEPPNPGGHAGRSRDAAAHSAEPPIVAAASEGIDRGYHGIVGPRRLRMQQAIFGAYELLFREATGRAQFSELAQLITQRHGETPPIEPSLPKTRFPQKSRTIELRVCSYPQCKRPIHP